MPAQCEEAEEGYDSDADDVRNGPQARPNFWPSSTAVSLFGR